jgi:DNA-binding MurR/RpiR family transcriptional regulator
MLRRQRWIGKQIAAETGVSPATVSRVLRRLGLKKLSALEPAEPIRRYERDNPGERRPRRSQAARKVFDR